MKVIYSLKHAEKQSGKSVGGADKVLDGHIVLYSTSKCHIAIRIGENILYWSTNTNNNTLYPATDWAGMSHETFPKGTTICFRQD